nr:probably inactive leucine-rich repeat receptor-like protein kinase At5g48380 isoform X1 [Ipomoea trifida]
MCSSCSTLLGLLLLLGSFVDGNDATETDISCLKSIKDSLEDPLGNLRSWKFNNNSQGFICSFKGIDCWNANESRVIKIALPNMGLKGQYPRGMGGCRSLQILDLSNNNFSSQNPYMVVLDLSSNNFDGEIPTSLANCTYLNVLKLDNNWLTGQIPSEIGMLQRLTTFSVANNMLSGPVPLFNDHGSVFPPESYANNDGLCGVPLEPCGLQHYLRSFISGFAEGWAIFTVLAMVISSFCMHTTKQKQALANRLIRHIRIKQYQIIDMLEKITIQMNLEELSEATCNFAETSLVGTGRMGETYKATLPNGCFLAIKRLHHTDSNGIADQFLTELLTLGRIRDRNFVPLLGFCWEMNTKLLVYNFMPNGNLHSWLQSRILEWPTRLKIAVGIARGLAWLHHNNLAHLGLTTKCILLDEDFEPRLSNFGQAKFVNPFIESSLWKNLVSSSTQIPESDCYEKDVHDLGTLYLELVEQRDSNHFPENNIGSSTSRHQHLIGKGFDDEILKFLEIVNKCLVYDPDERPTALEVYLNLRNILEGSEMNPNHTDEAAEICGVDDRMA